MFKNKMKVMMLFALTFMLLPGCAAIQHRNLEVSAKMSETVFLNPETLESGKPIYVRVTNTSDFQEIDFGKTLKDQITLSGRTITTNPKEAAYLLQANLLYLGEEKKDMTMEGAVAGGVGGAILGVARAEGRGYGGGLTGLAIGAAGAGIGALAGSMVHVDTYVGLVDISIKEAVEGGVTGTETASVSNGSSTSKNTTRNVSDSRQEYRTRIGVKAVQTNINREEAAKTISGRLASQIAGYFK
ncbi:complement resistance protein TraT [Citrifermentans bremense]|uniref:complement resistance protein TraT n=1 Tax=Citrifermentans bremense TaxID=60035 RepID=UPI000427123D|nr:complement resistance protein TraT [Citrifermentans bremense]